MNTMETILVNYEGHVATITINRPKALNALSTQVLTELNQALDEVAANNDVYALVLTGAGEMCIRDSLTLFVENAAEGSAVELYTGASSVSAAAVWQGDRAFHL